MIEFQSISLRVFFTIIWTIFLVYTLLITEAKLLSFVNKMRNVSSPSNSFLKRPIWSFLKLLSKATNCQKSIGILDVYSIVSFSLSLIPISLISISEEILIGDSFVNMQLYKGELDFIFIVIFIFLAGLFKAFGLRDLNNGLYRQHFLETIIIKAAISFIILLSIAPIVLLSGSIQQSQIIQAQSPLFLGIIPQYFFLKQPVSAIIFLIGLFFSGDMIVSRAGAEGVVSIYPSTIIGLRGSHLLMAMISNQLIRLAWIGLFVVLFMGGYLPLPGLGRLVETVPLLLYPAQILSFIIKSIFVMMFLALIRFSVGQLQFAQKLRYVFNWLIPVALLNLLLSVWVVYYYEVLS